MKNEVNKILENYYDQKIDKKKATELLKQLGIDALVQFILEEV